MKEAMYYQKLDGGDVRCLLCPHQCILKKGQTGICRGRKNLNGKLITLTYFKSISFALDPIEKKPLYHFHPGTYILSLGPNACNLQCQWCQNWQVSQEYSMVKEFTIEELIQMAGEKDSIGAAFTYTEPFMMIETIKECAVVLKKIDKYTVMVSNGYIQELPLKEILPYIDAFNIDIKAFQAETHLKGTKGKLEHVLRSVELIARSDAHLEVTCLIVPGINDNVEEGEKIFQWLSALNREIPLHLSRYFPAYHYHENSTSVETMLKMEEKAKKYLKYVYLGNMGIRY